MISDIVDKIVEVVGGLQTIRDDKSISVEDRLLLDQAQIQAMGAIANLAKTSIFERRE